MEFLEGKKSFVVGGATIALAILILLGLKVESLVPVLMILGGLYVIANRLAIKKAEKD